MSRRDQRRQKKLDRGAAGGRAGRGVDHVAVPRQAVARLEAGDLDAAERLCLDLAKVVPDDPDLSHVLGLVRFRQERFDEAAEMVQRCRRIRGADPQLLNNLGQVLRAAGRPEEAVAAYREALAMAPDFAAAHMNLANALADADADADGTEALVHYRRAVDLAPDNASIHYNMGAALLDRGDGAAAIVALERAVALDPAMAEAHNNLGEALFRQGDVAAAEQCFATAMGLAPGLADVRNNLGNVAFLRCRFAEAEAHYRAAVDLDPGMADAWHNLGNCCDALGDQAAAAAHARRAFELAPDDPGRALTLLHRLMWICAWPDAAALASRIAAFPADRVRAAETPFGNVSRSMNPADNLATAHAAETARRMAALPVLPPASIGTPAADGRLTVGYVSSDFRDHAIGHLTERLFAFHDRHRFRVVAYATGEDDASAYRRRIEADADLFRDIREADHGAAAAAIRDDGVDVLVDLNGYSRVARLEVFALRPAPVQVTWLGFPGTTGADFMDYVVADAIVAPQEHDAFFSEAVVCMPGCYQINHLDWRQRMIAAARADAGLPDDGLVFCSFNQAYKFDAETFAVWMDLLAAVPGSVLWLLRPSDSAVARLGAEAERRGVDSGRLVWASGAAKAEHLSRMALADIALDTRVYNGHTTTSDSLIAGVPVVALKGGHFASRVSASILVAAGLEDLVTGDLAHYAAVARRLATDDAWRADIRARLATDLEGTAMFDVARFVRDLEAAYAEMVRCRSVGTTATAIEVAALVRGSEA